MTLIHKIIEAIKQSDHEVVLPLVHLLDTERVEEADDYYVELVKNWMDGLQEMYDKAERVDDIENNLYQIDNLIDDAENSLSEIRGYTNV